MTISLVLLLLSGSGNCSDRMDKYTNLTECELKDLARQVRSAEAKNPLPREVFVLDSTIKVMNERKHRLLLDYKFNKVCDVCTANHLSCGNRKPNDTFFVCVSEHWRK